MTKFKYHLYLNSEKWKAIRAAVLARDGGKCRSCYHREGEPTGVVGLRRSRKQPTVLEVHHLTYQRVGHELLHDLILLCQVCHGKMNHPDYRRYIIPDRINKRALPLPGPKLTEPEPVPPEPLADGAGARAR